MDLPLIASLAGNVVAFWLAYKFVKERILADELRDKLDGAKDKIAALTPDAEYGRKIKAQQLVNLGHARKVA